MLVKTFKAGDMAEALKMVKAELGADAMILSSRKERKRGIMGIFSKPYFEVTAALDPRPAARPNPYREKEERELSTREEFQNSMLVPLARELRDLRDKVEKLSTREVTAPALPVEQPVEVAAPSVVSPPPLVEGKDSAPSKEIASRFAKEDMEEIKKYLLSMVNSRDKKGAVPVSFPQGSQSAVEVVAELPPVDMANSRSALE